MTAHAPDLLEVPAPGRVLGRPVLRSEDRALLTGAARYLDDVPCEGALHGVFVRSPIAHALVRSVDVDEACAMPGVAGVFVAEDMGGLRMPPVEDSPEAFARPLLAVGRVRFVGEPVAVVVAQTRAQAMDAADAVAVDYEPLPPVIDPEAALEPDAPILFQAHGSNLAIRVDDVAEDPGALEDAEIVVRARFVNQRVAPVPMEANGALAVAGAGPGEPSLTLWASVQAPHDTRRIVAQVLGLDPAQVRVRTAAVGGGFGGKIPTYPEHVVISWLARQMGTAVRWSETRNENMVAMTHGRGQVQHVELGATLDGRIRGLRVFVIQDIGAYASEAATLPPLTGLMASGPYRIPRIDFHAVSVVTTTTPVGAYRGAGRPEATWLLERALDMLTAELGIDPAEIRRRNFIPREAFPYRTPTGASYDSGDPGQALDIALRAAGYTDLRQEQAARIGRGETWQLGIGISSYVEITGWGSEFASVEADDQGTFTVLTGTSPQGQGHETAWAQIVADTLGVSFDAVTVKHSDTLLVPRGEGTMGSRSLQVGGSAVLRASVALLDKARRLAAHLLEISEGDVRRLDGRIGAGGAPELSLSWGELAAAAADPSSLPPGMETGLRAQADFEMEDSTYPFGAHVAVVEVDTETGKARLVRHVAVDDCGRRINPMLVEGQIHGGIAQGAAQALFESFVYDELGNPLTSSLATYAMPSAAELPAFVTVSLATPTDRNPLGAKGVGEGGTIGAGPAVQNAVIDALSHLGVRHIDMPMSPDRVWRAIRDAPRDVPGDRTRGGRHGAAGPEWFDRGHRDAHAERCDEESLRRYVNWLADQGVRGLAVNVDTGEGPHLFPEERLRVLQIVAEQVGGRALVVAGLAASFTEQARRLAADTARAGADALLVFPISAYQGEPMDPEIPASYHRAVAEASGLPLIAFQLQPALGGVNFPAEAIERIMSIDGVVAIKEASFDAKRFVETARLVKSLPSRPTVLNGNDNFLLEAYLLGAEGALLGFGTLAAREQVQMHRAVREDDLPRAFELRDMLQPLCDAIFARPVRDYRARVKHALMRLGVIDEAHVRPPLRPLSKDARDLVDGALKEAGLR